MAGDVVTRPRRGARRAAVRDAALSAGLLAAALLWGRPQQHVGALWWTATGLAAFAVALRSRWPVAMLTVCTVSAAVYLAVRMPMIVIEGGVLLLLFTVAALRPRTVSLAALAGLLL